MNNNNITPADEQPSVPAKKPWWRTPSLLLGFGGLALTALLGAVSSGLGGFFGLAGIYVLVVAIIGLIRGHVDWARLGTRAWSGGAALGAVFLLILGGMLTPKPAQTVSAPAVTATPSTSTPSTTAPAPTATSSAPATTSAPAPAPAAPAPAPAAPAPVPAPAPAPPAPAPTPVGPATTIEDGQWEVGTDVAPGVYKTTANVDPNAMCYWKITEHGNPDHILSNDIVKGGRPTVTIKTKQDFTTEDCGTWTKIG